MSYRPAGHLSNVRVGWGLQGAGPGSGSGAGGYALSNTNLQYYLRTYLASPLCSREAISPIFGEGPSFTRALYGLLGIVKYCVLCVGDRANSKTE
jgi:hypothetical protein